MNHLQHSRSRRGLYHPVAIEWQQHHQQRQKQQRQGVAAASPAAARSGSSITSSGQQRQNSIWYRQGTDSTHHACASAPHLLQPQLCTARAHALLLPGQVSTAVAAGVSTAAGLLTASQRHPQLLEALADQAYGVYDWAADHVPLLGTYPRLIGLGLGGLSAGGALYYMRWVDVSWAWGWGGCVVGLGLGWMSAGGALTRITCGGRMCRSGG